MKKRMLSLALALVIGLGLLPISVMAEVSTNTIQERIDQILEDHPAGTYFTVNGKACSHGAFGYCDNCKLSAIVKQEKESGKLPSTWKDDVDAWTCIAFARYAFQRAFGIPTNGKNNLNQYIKGDPGYDIFKCAEPGDLVYCFSDASAAAASDNVTAFHVAMVVSVNKNGAVILQSNADGTDSKVGTITYGTISYSSMKSTYGWKYVKLRRSTTQPKPTIIVEEPPLGVQFLPAAQSTWANKEKVEETNAVVVAQIKKNSGVKVTEMGLDLYDANGTLIKSYSQKVTTPDTSTSWPCYWDINEEIGVTLTPGTTYKYCFTGVFNGTKYESEMWSFQAGGPTPAPNTPTPEPPVTQPPATLTPESMEVRYKVEHYLERTDDPGNYKDKPETAEIYSGKAGQQVTLHPTSFDGYRTPAEQFVTLPNENSTYRIYYRLASYTVYLSAEPGIASMAGGGLYRYGEQVTLSARVEDGYQWAGWSDGSMQQTDYRFTMPSEDLTLTALATPDNKFGTQLPKKFPETREWSLLQFDDLSTRDWYYESVKSAYCYDLMNGRGVSEFAPNGTLTVAESITLAARIHAKYFGKTIPSYDGGAWYDGYVSYALQNGIYADGPYDIPATREVFARILAAALPEEELRDNGSSVSFADEDQIRYRSSVELLCQAGVINGVNRGGQTFFDPTDTITRAQAATIITRMVIPDNRIHP